MSFLVLEGDFFWPRLLSQLPPSEVSPHRESVLHCMFADPSGSCELIEPRQDKTRSAVLNQSHVSPYHRCLIRCSMLHCMIGLPTEFKNSG